MRAERGDRACHCTDTLVDGCARGIVAGDQVSEAGMSSAQRAQGLKALEALAGGQGVGCRNSIAADGRGRYLARMLLSLLYTVVTLSLNVLLIRTQAEAARTVELLALRQEVRVLRRRSRRALATRRPAAPGGAEPLPAANRMALLPRPPGDAPPMAPRPGPA